jgi:hypothetical protein
MKSTRFRDILVGDWPWVLYGSLSSILGVVTVIWATEPARDAFSNWTFWLCFGVAMLIAPVFIFFCGLPLGFIIFGPLFYLADKIAGAPFQVGDRVRILVGPHRDRIVEVYDVWQSRRQIRVWLDSEAEKNVTDVFGNSQVRRSADQLKQV